MKAKLCRVSNAVLKNLDLFFLSVEIAPRRLSSPRIAVLAGELCQQPGGVLESGVAYYKAFTADQTHGPDSLSQGQPRK